MSKHIQRKAKSAAIQSWLGIASLWGAGAIPCPDCGAPMILHFWPLALALTLLRLRRGKQQKAFELQDDKELDNPLAE